MIAEELINHMVPPIKVTDDAHKAILWMEELRCNQLPVVEDSKFLGLITEDVILETNEIEKSIKEYNLIGKDCIVGKNTHFYDIIKLATDEKATTVGVVDDDNRYIGAITVQDIVTAFAQSAAVQMPGGILVLSMDQRDYSLAEISRLIEENNVKILTSSVKSDPDDPNQIRVTIKLNTLEMQRVIATLERFDYKIIAKFKESKPTDYDREKIDMLFRYLEI